MQGETLDGMTVEQLRDLAARANTAAEQQAKKAEKDAKDLVPPVGTEWEYNGRYWVTEYRDDTSAMVLSIPKKGGPILGDWFRRCRFSLPELTGFCPHFETIEERSPGVIARLALRVRSER